jgi:hypothetical protein
MYSGDARMLRVERGQLFAIHRALVYRLTCVSYPASAVSCAPSSPIDISSADQVPWGERRSAAYFRGALVVHDGPDEQTVSAFLRHPRRYVADVPMLYVHPCCMCTHAVCSGCTHAVCAPMLYVADVPMLYVHPCCM